MTEDLLGTAFAQAYKEAEEHKAEEERIAAARAAGEAEAARASHVYDPRRYPESDPQDTRMYEGTGIGALYGLPATERFLPELGDWTLGRES